MICTPFTGQPVKGVHITTERLLYMQKRRFSTKNRRFIIPYYLKLQVPQVKFSLLSKILIIIQIVLLRDK